MKREGRPSKSFKVSAMSVLCRPFDDSGLVQDSRSRGYRWRPVQRQRFRHSQGHRLGVYTKESVTRFSGRRDKMRCTRHSLSAMRGSRSGCDRKSNYREERPSGAGKKSFAKGQWPEPPGKPTPSLTPKVFSPCPISWQCRRRYSQLFRVGAGPPGLFWRESEVNERLMDVMENAFDEVVRYAETHKVNNRIAA